MTDERLKNKQSFHDHRFGVKDVHENLLAISLFMLLTRKNNSIHGT